ncbi:MAG: cache domain-containing protein [Minisyncoccia bacterium]|jgi:hypothetical protein
MQRLVQLIVTIATKPSRKPWVSIAIIAIFLILPLLILESFVFVAGNNAGEDQPSIKSDVSLLSLELEGRLTHLVDVGTIFSERILFRQRITAGNWTDALTYTSNPMFDTSIEPYIDRVIITNTSGTLMAASPLLAGTVGRDFSYQDWFISGRGATSEPYISSAYQKIQSSPYSVIGISFPILDPLYKDRVAGILILQVKNIYFSDWLQGLNVDPDETLYVVDRKGQVVTHTNPDSSGNVVNIAGSPIVQKILNGESGEEIAADPLGNGTKDAAYAPTSRYGWGIMLEKPLSQKSGVVKNLAGALILSGFLILYACFFASVIIKIVKLLNRQ